MQFLKSYKGESMKSFFGEFYTGKDGEKYFYLPLLKSVYKIPDEDLVTFNAFRHRLIIALAMGAIIYSFYPESILLSILAALLFYALSTIAYVKSILSKYLVKKEVFISEIEKEAVEDSTVPIVKTWMVSLVGILIIAGSFFVSGEILNRMIVIAFGLVVTFSGTSAMIKNTKK
jgi:hypothetical protein